MIKFTHMHCFAMFKKENFLSLSKIKIFIFTIALTISLGFFNSGQIFALDGAKWLNDSKDTIVYNGKNYKKISSSEANNYPDNLKGKNLFVYYEANLEKPKKEVIALDDNNDITKGIFQDISETPLGRNENNGNSQPVEVNGTQPKKDTNCNIEGGGGWMVCSVANTLAWAMDGIYDIVQNFLKVQPLYVKSDNPLFKVWDYMRNIANIIFIIAFIFVIYSQLTSMGISNYGIKRMLPKIIVAAILINLSYYICAVLVDTSNIIGAQLQNLLVNIRKEMISSGPAVNINLSWKDLTAAVLSSAGVFTYGAVAYVIAGGWQALGLMIMGALVMVIYSAFVALVILAGRQAIIIVLVFLSPLAFAANILPNTEKWYGKWKDLLSTMLIMYPIISLLFGGAQLVGTVIIASSNGNFLVFLLGAVTQVAPLALTPTIMKLSGNLLGKIAGIVNNPNKGPVDAARRFFRDGAEEIRHKKISDGNNLTAKLNQLSYGRSRRQGNMKSIAEKYQQARFDQKESEGLNVINDETVSDFTRARMIGRNTAYQQMVADQYSTNQTEAVKNQLSTYQSNLLNSPLETDIKGNIIINEDSIKNLNKRFGQKANILYDLLNDNNALKQANRNNAMAINSGLHKTLRSDDGLLEIAKGVRGNEGKISALADTFRASSKEKKEEVDSISTLLKGLDLNGNDYKSIFDDPSAKTFTKNGVSFDINESLRAAASEGVINSMSMAEAQQLLENTAKGEYLHANRGSLMDAFAKSKKPDNPFIGGGFVGSTYVDGKTSGDFLKEIDAQYIKKVSDENIIKANDEALKMVFRQEAIQKWDDHTVIATLKSFQSINADSSKYGRINAVQGNEIFEAVKNIKTHHNSIYKKLFSSGDIDLNNIKTKKA